MAIHYISDLIHVTCASRTGRRRSPMTEASYISELPLLDKETGRTIYRPHKDGTVIWGTEIVCYDESCPYADPSIPIRERWENMNNDTYNLMKKNGEQHHASFYVALPNTFTKEYSVECAKELAMRFSQKFNRPVGYGIHWKKNNLHVHFNIPEWAWINGKWSGKGNSYYKGKDGSKLFGKKDFYDSEGNDLRIPLMETVTLPDGESVTRQKRGKKNERLWVRVNEKPFYNQCEWIHEEADNIINRTVTRAGTRDYVFRANKTVKDKLKAQGMTPWHINRQSYKNKDERYNKATAHNKREKSFRTILTENINRQDKVNQSIRSQDEDIKEIDKAIKRKSKKIQKQQEADLDILQNNAIEDYVKTSLRPAEKFIEEAANIYQNQYLSMKKEILRPLIETIDNGVRRTEEQIQKITDAPMTKRSRLKQAFLDNNVLLMNTVREGVYAVVNHNSTEIIKDNARKRWNGLSGWRKLNYVKSRMGNTASIIYKEYLNLRGDCPKEENVLPIPFALPDTKIMEDNIKSLVGKWQKAMENEDGLPPTDVRELTEIITQEGKITGTAPTEIFTLPKYYQPEQNLEIYQNELEKLQREEEAEAELERRKKEADRLAREKAEREEKERLEKERLAKIEAERREKERLAKLEQERIAEQKRIQEQEAERKRMEEQRRKEEEKRLAEKRRIAEEKRLAQLAAERKAEEKRIAEQKRIEEERRIEAERLAEEKRKEEEHRLTSSAQDSVAPSDGGMAPRVTKADYYVLSDKLVIEKLHIMISITRMTVADGSREFRSIMDGIQYYDSHSKVLEADMERYGTDSEKYKSIQGEMQRIWPIVKDEEYARPMMLNQKPDSLIDREELLMSERRIATLMQQAQKEKIPLIKELVGESVTEYMMYENLRRQDYNFEHYADEGFVRKQPIEYDDARKELAKIYKERTDIFIEAAQRKKLDITPYTAPIEEADSLKKALEESYIYYSIQDKNAKLAKKKKKTVVRTKTMDKDRQTEK